MPQNEEGATTKYHSWPHENEGVDPGTGINVSSAQVNDSVDNPTSSVLTTRIVMPIKAQTLLSGDDFRKQITAGFTRDKHGNPAVWIKQPCTFGTPLENKMLDLQGLAMYANAMCGGDNKTLNEAMNTNYIEAADEEGLDNNFVDVVTLPDLSAYKAENYFYSNAKYNNYPDKKNELTIPPTVNHLRPIVYIPDKGKKVKHLDRELTIFYGFIMVQVYVEGSQRKLIVPSAKSDEGDYDTLLAAINNQIKDGLKFRTSGN
jgi:hypothetical protein